MKSRSLIATITLLLLCSGTFGQKRRARTSATVPSHSTAQIDPSIKQLPRNYEGADPQILYEALEKRSKENVKGEFETTEAFKTRVAREETRPLTGSITRDGLIPLAVSKESDIFDKVTSLYDADKNELAISIEMDSAIIGVQADLDKRSLPLRYVFRPSSFYIGQNAYGARVKIEKRYTYIFALLLENFRDFLTSPSRSYKDVRTVRLNMTPIEALAAKPVLRVLVLARLREPYFRQGFTRHEPTVLEPKDTLSIYQYLVADATEFWFYNYATGEIYAKLQPRRAPTR